MKKSLKWWLRATKNFMNRSRDVDGCWQGLHCGKEMRGREAVGRAVMEEHAS
jgi:hypothetical protein